MRVLIAGGHGQVARHLTRRLSGSGHQVVGVVRDSSQARDLVADGARPVVLDLEAVDAAGLADVTSGCDAVVFAAGAGPGSGAARKRTVDHDAAVLLMDACERADVDRYVMISALGTDDPPDDEGVFSVYLRAKAEADQALRDRDLRWTVVRPGRLVDAPATGRVRLAPHVPRGEVTREDVAAVLAEVLVADALVRRTVELVAGDEDVAAAVAAAQERPVHG